jgi:serine/threonine-protein kinase
MTSRCPACGASYGEGVVVCARDGTRLVPSNPVAMSPGAAAREPPREPPRARAPVNLAGRTLADRYRVERKVGEGGMALVYLATDVRDGRRVAVKALTPLLAADPKALARLRREAAMGQRLDHPNVCPILELVETPDGVVAIVMSFLEGELLCDRAARLVTMPLAQVVPVVRDIAAGLQAAHEIGIIHRDLKPENVMLCPTAEGGERAVVMDFGLAKQHQAGSELEKLTGTGIVLGTPEFMSPEQLRGKPLDGRSDIYALALVAFELLTSQLPFRGRTKNDMMLARLKYDPIPLREVRPDVANAAALEHVLMRALSRDRGDRQRTALEFADAFAAAAAGEGGGKRWWERLLGR